MAPVVVKIIIAALALVIGALIGYIYRKMSARKLSEAQSKRQGTSYSTLRTDPRQ